ncbi:transcriptional regulator, partial [Photobacterium damselae subsp. damselae]
MTLEQLQEGLDKLTQVVDERVQEEDQLRAENREKEEKLETYRQLLLADGIDPEELIQAINATPKKQTRKQRPAKYRYTEH